MCLYVLGLQNSFFLSGWTEMVDWCLIFLYTELIKSTAACLTVSCVSAFKSYRHMSSQYRILLFICLVDIFIYSINFYFQEPLSHRILCTFINFMCSGQSIDFSTHCIVFMYLTDWTINFKWYKLTYIFIVISSTTVSSKHSSKSSKTTFANRHV